MSQIQFYSHLKGPYSCFSNFSPHSVTIDGVTYETTEHYFQCQKFIDNPSYMEKIRLTSGPGPAKFLGSTRLYPIRKDWEKIKEDVMMKCLMAKFTQHLDLQKILLDTGDKILVEHTKNDTYWADGGNGEGKNRLGHCLMETRKKLASAKI